LAELRQAQKLQTRQTWWAAITGGLIISTTILFVANQSQWLVALSGVATLLSAIVAWRRTN